MAGSKKKVDLFETEAGLEIEQKLINMAKDAAFNTRSSYNSNSDKYPDNTISFVNKHKEYLRSHPSTDPQHYLSNLKLITRLK